LANCVEPPVDTTGSKGLPPPSGLSDVGSAGLMDCCAPVACVGTGRGGGADGGPDEGPGGGLSVGMSFASVSVLEGVAVEETTGVRVLLERAVETVLEAVAVEAVLVFLLDVGIVVPAAGHNRFTRFPFRTCPSTELSGAVA